MAYGVIILNSIGATNIDARILNFKSDVSDIDNGGVFSKTGISTDMSEGEVFMADVVDIAAGTVYMAYTAGDIVVEDSMGEKYKLGLVDPRKYTNLQGFVFNGFAPMVGDRIQATMDCFAGSMGANEYVVAVDGTLKMEWAAAPGAGLSWKIVKRHDIAMAPTGELSASNRVEAYQFECVAI